MKTRKTFELELMRRNVTPAQFLAYLRSMQKKHPEMGNDFNLNMFKVDNGFTFDYTNALPGEKPCAAERSTDRPFEKQTYIMNFDGSCYNEIVEFQFETETTGYGYYYTVNVEVDDADREANTAEHVAAIAARRLEVAAHNERKADAADAAANEAERNGYASAWWIESKRFEAARLRNEAAETRAAVKAATETAAPEETPAETAAPVLMLETVAASLARLDAAALVKYYADETAAMYDGPAGTIDDASLDATWAALQTIDPAAFRAWMNAATPIADAYDMEERRQKPGIVQAIEREDIRNLRAAYGV